MEFIEKRAKELYSSSSGLSKSADQFGFGYPFLSYIDIFHNYYAPEELTTLVNSTQREREKCSVLRGDVFLTRTSETTEELGMSCVALKDYPNATFNGFAKRLRPLTDEIYPEYAAYYFRSPFFRGQCQAMASLITRASLNDGMISRLKIRYPKEKALQIRIGQVLNTFDRLIENNSKRISVLEQLVENIYKEWFVRLRFPGYDNSKYECGLPDKWTVVRIGDVIIEKSKSKVKVSDVEGNEGPYPFYTSGRSILRFNNYQVDGENILLNTGGIADVKFSLGKAHYSTDTWCICGTSGRTLYLYLLLKNMLPEINSSYFEGAALKHLKKNSFKKKKIIIPSDAIIQQFNRTVSAMIKEAFTLREANLIIAQQRDRLLPRLMNGKIVLSEAFEL